jgi:hypothetical protein
MRFKIIENFLDYAVLQNMYNFMTSGDMPYYFCKKFTTQAIQHSKSFFFIHHLYKKETKEKSFVFDNYTKELFLKLDPNEIIRAQVNNFIIQDTNIVSDAHVDEPDIIEKNLEPYKTALFYLNTCNGGTILHTDEGDIKINSKENRLLIFDGNISHRAVTQTDTTLRLNINVVFR